MISMRFLATGEARSKSSSPCPGCCACASWPKRGFSPKASVSRIRSRSLSSRSGRVLVGSCTGVLTDLRTPRASKRYQGRRANAVPPRIRYTAQQQYTSRGVEGLARRSPGNHRVPTRKVPIPDRCVAGFTSYATREKAKTTKGAQMAASNLKCRECKAEYPLEALYVCERCFGPLEVGYDHSRLVDGGVQELRRRIQGGPQNIWRYADFLPLAGGPPGPSGRLASRTGLPAGCTPLVRADRLAQRLGLGEVWVKNDAANPTHSFKDRVVAVAAARARELGYQTIACASTGNLANSVAAHGAAMGLDSYVFIPADLEEQKVLATGVYGTRLVAVKGNYDEVNRLCTELSAEREWAFVNINLRPYYAEGSKTLAFEIAEQLGWELPDRCVVPIASGSLFTKIAKGFEEWRELGLIHGDLPKMNGAQADGCSPIATAFANNNDICKPVKP